MSKPDSIVLYYFLYYCKSRQKGWDDLMEAMLNALHDHGFDVKDINGKWCLVKLEPTHDSPG